VITMHTKKRTLAWLLLLICTVPGLGFAGTRGKLFGKIHDAEGKGIPGVVVTITSPQIPGFKEVLTTDKKGVFSVGFSKIDVTYRYRFDKPGFQTMEFEQAWHLEGTQQLDWTMQPGVSAAVAAPGAAPAVSTSGDAIDAYNAAIAALKANDNATAETKFKEAIGHDPNLVQAWAGLSSVQVELGHNKEAAEAAEKAIALGLTDQAVYLVRWQAYRNLNDDAKAAEALKDLERVGRAGEEAKRIHNEGVALVKAGDDAGAFAKFQEALQLDPNLKPSLIGLATAGIKLGKYAEAASAAETILKTDPNNEAAIRLRFNACLELGDKARLADALVGLAAVEPVKARDGLLRLAFQAYDASNMPLAKQRFGQAIAIDPTFAQAHYYLGLVNVSLGASAEARQHFERFLQLAPNDPEANSAREALKYLK
jgi:Tfp pilus assembly protein PilF